MSRAIRGVAWATAVVVATAVAASARAAESVRVSVGAAAHAPFPQDKQNEPAVAIDPAQPQLVAAGANDWIDSAPCSTQGDGGCDPSAAVGGSGVYLSADGGASWVQPQYRGLTQRDCTDACDAHEGPIGTLPHYDDLGLVSEGDPSLAFGPAPDAHGGFSWSAGARLYYANLATTIAAATSGDIEDSLGVAVSTTDDVRAAAAGDAAAWRAPTVAALPDDMHSYDKDAVWADDAASSRWFGRAYVCAASFGAFRSDAIAVFHSADGGATWSRPTELAAPPDAVWQGCALRTDSHGTVYLAWLQMSGAASNAQLMLARSTDGGVHFSSPKTLAGVDLAGLIDPIAGGLAFSGVGGVRTNSMPSLDIANGAPSGADATNEIAVAWTNGPTPSGSHAKKNERVALLFSHDGGATWSHAAGAAPAGDRPDMPAVALAPNGVALYLVYDDFLQPWERSAARGAQLMESVVRRARIGIDGKPGGWTDVERGPTGDVRATSTDGLDSAFIGDYNSVAATRESAVALWNDARGAVDCPAVDRYRQALADGGSPAVPEPQTSCAAGFGNSDVFAEIVR